MRKILLGFAIGAILGGLFVGAFYVGVVHAQNPLLSPYQISVPTTIAASLCAPVPGMASLCLPGDGNIYMSANGGAFVKLGAGAAAPSLTINGVTKTLPNTFTLTGAQAIAAN